MSEKFFQAIILASIPIMGYWVTYQIEVGYLRHFLIPEDYIQVPLESVFYCMTALLSVLAIFWIFAWQILELIPIKFHRIASPFMPVIILALLSAIVYSYLGAFNQLFVLLAGSSVLGSMKLLIATTHKEGTTFAERAKKVRQEKNYPGENILDKTKESPRATRIVLIITFVLLITGTFQHLGLFWAKDKRSFYTTVIDDRNYALIRKYNDLTIYVPTKKRWRNLYDYDEVTSQGAIHIESSSLTRDLHLSALNKHERGLQGWMEENN